MIFFFFQAEDGIRDLTVTGVQTCALPILVARRAVDRLRHVDRPGRVRPEDPCGRPREGAATHARPRLLRSPRLVARRPAHRGDQRPRRPPGGGAFRARPQPDLPPPPGRAPPPSPPP